MPSMPNLTLAGSRSGSIPYSELSIDDSFHIIQMVTLTLSSAYIHNTDSTVVLPTTHLTDTLQNLGNICRESTSSSTYSEKTFYCENSIPRQHQDIILWGFNYNSINQVRWVFLSRMTQLQYIKDAFPVWNQYFWTMQNDLVYLGVLHTKFQTTAIIRKGVIAQCSAFHFTYHTSYFPMPMPMWICVHWTREH